MARISGREGPDPIGEVENHLRHRFLDAFLLMIALAGGVLVFESSQEQARIREKLDQMTRTTGEFSVTDPSRIHVLAVDTGEPLHFAWHVYLPADYELIPREASSGPVRVTSPSSIPARELILRVRFREDNEGRLDLYQKHENGSQRGSFGNKALSRVLHGRFDKVLVQQMGKHSVESVGVNEPLDLLSLKLPEDLEAEIRKGLPPEQRAKHDPRFFQFAFGPEAKKPPTTEEEEPTP
jgi:hypothetical protein